MADILISYRREDTRGDAGRINDRLVKEFGNDRVFMDVDDIAPGANFVEQLQTTLASCAAVVVVIGKHWIGRDENGQSRLNNPADFVRIEVTAALARGVPVIPVLVGGAAMPRPEEVPEDLQALLNRQAIEVRHTRFNDDVEKLVEVLLRTVKRRHLGLSRRTAIGLFAIAGVILASFGFQHFSGRDVVNLRVEPTELSTKAAQAMLARLNLYDVRQNASGLGLTLNPVQSLIGEDVVILEHSTGLMWQNSHFSRSTSQAVARDIISQANESGFAGFRDWRLPTLEEAMSLMTPEATAGIHIPPQFNARLAPFIWTADGVSENSGWVVYYVDGFALPERLHFNASVRAVRSVRD